MMTLLEKQQNNTDNFLTSYEIQKNLSEISGYDENLSQETSDKIVLDTVKDYNSDLKCGQVRLLADIKEITYILLLKKWDDESFLVTAFSHYNFPATNEELALGCYVGAYLNVLQIWNTRTLRNSILKKSWVCGEVTQKVCDEAWQFWLSLLNDNQLSDTILARTGTPIQEHDDIRIEYIEEEMSLWNSIDEDDLAEIENDAENVDFPLWNISKLMIPPLWQQENISIAAGNEKDNIWVKCAIDGRNEFVTLEYSPEEMTLWLDVFDDISDNNVCCLDRTEIVNVDGTALGEIINGKAIIKNLKNFDGCLALRLEDQTVLLLTPQRQGK